MGSKSVAEKLLVKPASTIWSSDGSRLDLIGPLPERVLRVDSPEQATVALVFADDAGSVRENFDAYKGRLTRAEVIWVAYPKANRVDINRDTLWPILAEYGLRPISQVAIDHVWSALRFRPLKEGEAPFTGGQ